MTVIPVTKSRVFFDLHKFIAGRRVGDAVVCAGTKSGIPVLLRWSETDVVLDVLKSENDCNILGGRKVLWDDGFFNI